MVHVIIAIWLNGQFAEVSDWNKRTFSTYSACWGAVRKEVGGAILEPDPASNRMKWASLKRGEDEIRMHIACL